MKNLIPIGLLFLFACLLFTSCRKDEETTGRFPPDTTPTPDIIVNGSFSGVLTDDTNQGIEEALITFGTNSTTTDENGYFSFTNVEINEEGSLVTAEKEGYFYNSKFIHSELNKHNFTKIKMIPKILTGNFMASSGGTVATSDGASVEFSANAIQTESGGTYNGNVNVYATWLDPTSADISQIMPGDLRGMNTDNERQQLITFGMIAVELEDDAGESLNIADGQTATITIPVPDALIANAPTIIPLWYFNESTGYWMEEGQATLQGNQYVGTVSHFSFWNCDLPGDFVFIDGKITDANGAPLPNTLIKITAVSSGMVRFGWTNEDGVYAGAVPKDQELNIFIKDNCGNEIYSELIGPFSTDVSIPNITVNTDENFYTISGTLVNCENNPIANGYLKIDFGFGPLIVLADENGTFSETVNICNATTVETTGFDIVNSKKSNTLIADLSGLSSLDLANVLVCEDLTEFMIYTIAGIETIDEAPHASFETGTGAIILNAFVEVPPNTQALPAIQLRINAPSPGIFTPKYGKASYADSTPQLIVLLCSNTTAAQCDLEVEFTTIETVGGFVVGSFIGTMSPLGTIGTTQDVSGSFKILLEE